MLHNDNNHDWMQQQQEENERWLKGQVKKQLSAFWPLYVFAVLCKLILIAGLIGAIVYICTHAGGAN